MSVKIGIKVAYMAVRILDEMTDIGLKLWYWMKRAQTMKGMYGTF